MKKRTALISLTALFLTAYAFSSNESTKQYEGSGEVVSSDPVYSRVTIQHKSIKGFVGGDETEFVTATPGLLKGINRYDLVDFSFEDNRGNVEITKITKTGVAAPKEDSLPLGEAVQGVLTTTGEVAKAATAPIPAVGEAVSGAVGSSGDAPRPVAGESGPEVKRSF